MKALEARWGRLAALAAVGSFLAVDLALFGNCIMPTQDANPRPVEEGTWQAGATGTALFGIPAMGGVEVRRGLSNGDVGAHAFFEILGDRSTGFHGDEPDTTIESFRGGEHFALGLDRKTLLRRSGNTFISAQYGLNGRMGLTTRGLPSASLMGGLLMGKDWIYISPRLHLGYQRSPFFQVEMPMALQFQAWDDRLGIELGVNPALIGGGGFTSIPWPYQFLAVRWRFGG